MVENLSGKIYISVILPLKYRGEATYVVPEELAGNVVVGSRVKVDFAGKVYCAVVKGISGVKDISAKENDDASEAGILAAEADGIVYKDIISVEPFEPVCVEEMALWQQVADYYLCSVGEVFKAAYPASSIRQEQVKSRKSADSFFEALSKEGYGCEPPQLSPKQAEALESIKKHFSANSGNNSDVAKKPVLLHGVTGSGKTEIYITLAIEQLKQGRSVLYMAPEIAITKQLQMRLKKLFGSRLLVYHSKQTAVEKKLIRQILGRSAGAAEPVVVLGTRSALFLPYRNLGLVVVDEEHDSSYKQSEPAPRYQARDVAIMLANIHRANILLGSATPSFESEYNCLIGRFSKVTLLEKYYGAAIPKVEIIDTIWARKSGQMRGNFSQKLLNVIKKRVGEGKQVLIFKNRRSYSPVVECTECGNVAKCPHCNVNLSYHKYNSTLRCHYCDYTTSFSGICKQCGLDALKYKGAGTERLEEELKELLPDLRIARFDADIASDKRAEEAVIKEFSEGNIDLLIGTQMISKGFDFKNLKLVAVIDADSLLAMQDFRADEKALQTFSQLMGRAGRRDEPGELLIQTNHKAHPVLQSLLSSGIVDMLMAQRHDFGFAPFVRMVKIIVKHADDKKLDILCNRVAAVLGNVGALEITGPFVPQTDKVRGEWLKAFYVKFARNRELQSNKHRMLEQILSLKCGNAVIIDVDPL